MLKFTERSRSFKILSILCLSFWLNGCTVKPVKEEPLPTVFTLGDAPLTPGHYQRQADTAPNAQRPMWLLMASRAHVNQGNTAQAAQLLAIVAEQLPTTADARLEYQLLNATVLSHQGQTATALAQLKRDLHWQLSDRRWQQFFQLRAELHFKLDHPIDAAIALINKEQYLKHPPELSNNHKLIWFYLSQSSAAELRSRQSNAEDFGGWKSLRLLTFHHSMNPDVLVTELKRWRLNYSSHPAAGDLPSNLTQAMALTPYQPQKIALLLPLSGRFARSGRALRDGVITSVMTQQSNAELVILDTQALGARSAYEQALQAGAEFIVGPLLKPDVEALQQITPRVPMLVLNVPEQLSSARSQQYFFALDRKSEATQGVERIISHGKRHPAIIAPDTPQGHQLAEHFILQWQQQTADEQQPTDALSYFFANDSQLQKTISQLFEVTQSQKRINEMRYLLTSKLKSETRSRRDIDAIYLIASPRQTRLLKPFVDVAVSQFAPTVAVYVGSAGNDNSDNQQDNRDINQLNVSEIPWLLNQIQPVAPKEVKTLWPDLNQSQLRLYAMGYDAFDLIGKLAQMELFPEYKLRGLSGELSLDETGKIQRQLNWAQYQRGKLVSQ